MTKQEKTKPSNKNLKNKTANGVKAAAWMVEASFRGFVGVITLQHLDGYLATAIAVYALGTAGLIVASHFAKAYK